MATTHLDGAGFEQQIDNLLVRLGLGLVQQAHSKLQRPPQPGSAHLGQVGLQISLIQLQ